MRQLIKQVFLKRASSFGVPSAIQKVSVANTTLNKSKLSLLASVTKMVKNQHSLMAEKYKRKFREHEISVEGIKRFKAEMGKIGNPRMAHMVEPTSYQEQGVHKGWTDVISSCPIYQQSMDIEPPGHLTQ